MNLKQPPKRDQIDVFKVPPGTFINMVPGCWHAGPMFLGDYMDFYNLELSDTNVTDHNTHVYSSKDGVAFDVTDSLGEEK